MLKVFPPRALPETEACELRTALCHVPRRSALFSLFVAAATTAIAHLSRVAAVQGVPMMRSHQSSAVLVELLPHFCLDFFELFTLL